MTGVLILQQPSSSSPVDHWLLQADPRADLTLITGPRSVRRGEYAEGVKVIEAKDYFSPETMAIAYDEARAMGADRIVSNAEQDVLRVAEIRDALGLPGMSAHTALAFRDKLMMKRLFANAGLAAAPASAERCVSDIVALAHEHGRGVVKPLDGMGAKGLVTIDADARHADVLAAVTPVLDDLHAGRLMWEKYVVGDGLHCDVTLSGPDIKTFSVSRTLAPPGAYATHNYTSYTLDKSDPTYPEARRCVEHLVESLPRDHGATMLHFELFESPNGSGVTAGEVGARMGGGGIRAAVREATGRDLAREGYLLAAGLGDAITPTPPPETSAGWMLFTAVVPALGDPLPEWVASTWTRPRTTAEPQHSVDAVGGMIVRANSSAELRRALESIEWHTESG